MEKKEIASQDDLLAVLDLLDKTNIQYWLDGGWGVDVLAGKQTREHRDIDIHPFILNDDGTAKQADLEGGFYQFEADIFGTAVFKGRTIPCISAKGQKLFHTGYELRDVDKHDIKTIEMLYDFVK